MAAAISITNTRASGAIGAATGHGGQEGINFRGLRHRRLPVDGVSDADTLTTGLPNGMVAVAWEPDATGEECNATVSGSTVTFHTDGVTSYGGYLHIWSASS